MSVQLFARGHATVVQRKYVIAALLLVTILVPLGWLPSVRSTVTRVEPSLMTLAYERPDASLHVIVQKLTKDTAVEDLVVRLGGTITHNLHIINGFAATLPARAVPELAHAEGVRWVSLDVPVVKTGSPEVSPANLKSAYIKTINADKVWTQTSKNFQGQGIGVAVVDSGINPQQDFFTKWGVNRIVTSVAYNNGWNQTVFDGYSHGTHVAGVIGGNGSRSNGAYVGVAPMVNLINVKVSDDAGAATSANVVHGLQWIYENHKLFNIRVVNISLNESALSSYHNSPLNAAAEILWFNKIVVVVSAGNFGKPGALYAPANDPFVITVGATDDKGTPGINDDTIANFSAYGTTSDGFAKPDLVAPGRNIVSLMANTNMGLPRAYPRNVVDTNYFRMSGTSMSAPMVAGAAALILQANPNLTPDQVKYRLKATARPFDTPERAGAGYLDVYAAVTGTTTQSANTGIPASKMLWSGSQPLNWNSANWNSANWNSANWNSANWNSANWNSANWNSDYWGD
jgi:serine protease AprX